MEKGVRRQSQNIYPFMTGDGRALIYCNRRPPPTSELASLGGRRLGVALRAGGRVTGVFAGRGSEPPRGGLTRIFSALLEPLLIPTAAPHIEYQPRSQKFFSFFFCQKILTDRVISTSFLFSSPTFLDFENFATCLLSL